MPRSAIPQIRERRDSLFGRQNSPLGLFILITETGPDIDDTDAVLQNHAILALIVRHALAVIGLRRCLILRAEDEVARGRGGIPPRSEYLVNQAVEVTVSLGHRLEGRCFSFGERLVDETVEAPVVLWRRRQCRHQGQADQGQRGNQSPHDSRKDSKTYLNREENVLRCNVIDVTRRENDVGGGDCLALTSREIPRDQYRIKIARIAEDSHLAVFFFLLFFFFFSFDRYK